MPRFWTCRSTGGVVAKERTGECSSAASWGQARQMLHAGLRRETRRSEAVGPVACSRRGDEVGRGRCVEPRRPASPRRRSRRPPPSRLGRASQRRTACAPSRARSGPRSASRLSTAEPVLPVRPRSPARASCWFRSASDQPAADSAAASRLSQPRGQRSSARACMPADVGLDRRPGERSVVSTWVPDRCREDPFVDAGDAVSGPAQSTGAVRSARTPRR